MGDLGSIPGLGRSPGEGNGYPLQYSGLENSMNCISHGVTESDFHFILGDHTGLCGAWFVCEFAPGLPLCYKFCILFSFSFCIICNVTFHSHDNHIKPFLSQGGTYTKPKTGEKKKPNQHHILLEMQNSLFGPVFNRIPYVTSSKPCKTSLKTTDPGLRTL